MKPVTRFFSPRENWPLLIWGLFSLGPLGYVISLALSFHRAAREPNALWINAVGLVLAIYASGLGLYNLYSYPTEFRSRLRRLLTRPAFWRFVAYLVASALAITLTLGHWIGQPKYVFRAALLAALLGLMIGITQADWFGRARHRLRFLDLVLFNCLLTLCFAEVGLRAASVFISSPLLMRYESNNKIESVRKPGGFRMGFQNNSAGYYDREFHPSKAPSTYRILALGDSFAAGIVPYSYNVLTLLEENLNQALNTASIEVYNMGVSGIDAGDYRYLFLKEGITYQPDMVLILFYLGNDFGGSDMPRLYDRHGWVTYFALDRYLTLRREADRQGIAISDVGQASQRLASWTEPPYLKDPSLEPPSYSREAFLQIERNYLKYFRSGPKGRRKRREGRTFRALGDIVRVCQDSSQIPVVLMILPTESMVNPEHYQAILDHWQEPPEQYDLAAPTQALIDFCAQVEIDHLDLTPALQTAQQAGHRSYHRHDIHWNATGNRVAAAAMAEYLIDKIPPGRD